MVLAGWVLGTAAGLGLAAGLLIGSIGVGGIILVPSLIELPIGTTDDERIGTAVASCMFSYIFVGLAGGYAYTRKKSVNWFSALWILIGAVPGGGIGAVIVGYLNALWIKLLLYSLVMVSAVYSMYRTIKQHKLKEQEAPSTTETEADTVEPGSILDESGWKGRVTRVGIGTVVGLGSALTGTSGPVILLPILLSLHWHTLDALGSAQVVQLPIALAAVAGFLATGGLQSIDWALGGCLAVGLVPGALLGAAVAHALPVDKLRLGVASILVMASVFLLGKLVYTHILPLLG